jgi:hypothetical protein
VAYYSTDIDHVDNQGLAYLTNQLCTRVHSSRRRNGQLVYENSKGIEVDEQGSEEFALKIRKNIYGQKQAGRIWNKHLVSKLLSVGFKQSMIDKCVFYKGKSLYVLYTDDSILAGPDEDKLNTIVEEMKSNGLDLTVDGDISDFLGVNIRKDEDGTVHLTQPHLIEQILKELKLDRPNVGRKTTPSPHTQLLRRHNEAAECDFHFGYRSIVGKRSRTGYVITYSNCPVIWASKLQTQVALSTTESEYIALSTALREVI